MAFSKAFDLRVSVFRLFNVYGPRQNPIGAYSAVIPRWTLSGFKKEPISVFGDGVSRLLTMALMLVKVKEGILLIDELGTAIHTEALQFFFKWLVNWSRKMKVQIFATTHSLEVIDALLVANTDDDQLVLYRIEPNNSETHAVRLNKTILKTLREELGQEVRW